MTLDDLRRAAELLPSGSSLTLPRDVLLDALKTCQPDFPAPVQPDAADEWLTVAQVMTRLNVKKRWCYDNAKQLGAKKFSRRCVRFSARAVAKHTARRTS